MDDNRARPLANPNLSTEKEEEASLQTFSCPHANFRLLLPFVWLTPRRTRTMAEEEEES